MNIKKTANLLLNFTVRKLAEIFGILVSLAGIILLLALITYSPNDPNFIFPENTKIENLMGFHGSFISDLFFEYNFFTILYLLFGTLFFSHYYSDVYSLYINGNSGFVGQYLSTTFLKSIIIIDEDIFFYILILLIISIFLISINFNPKNLVKFFKRISSIISKNE